MTMDVDYSLLLKFLTLLLGGGTVAAGVKLMTRRLELVYQERAELRRAAAADPIAEDDHYAKIYSDLIETLTKQIDRLRSEADVADHRQANNLSLFKSFAEKTQQAIEQCHEERRQDKIEFNRQIESLREAYRNERKKRKAVELRLHILEQQSDPQIG